MELSEMSCMDCRAHACEKNGKPFPAFCPTTNKPEIKEKALQETMNDEDRRVMIAAAETESEGYLKLTRLEEIILFAKKIKAERIGIASCMGLAKESALLTEILRKNGFKVFGAVCKTGSVPKHTIGIPIECEEIGSVMCNPVMQAELLNDAKTDLNIIVGLCVGHDSLFIKHSDALCTSFITKDRVLAHNPAAALYLSGSYYKRIMNAGE